ncbi:MAG: WD40 repeat domain-containing protein, partial [Treponema sp.]|nr:WD40 repeat domain-containing protein [Treponema sp.]
MMWIIRIALIPVLFLFSAAFGQAGPLPGPHRGAIPALAGDGERIISAGEDGFLELWNIREGRAEERFQTGFLPLVSMARQPGENRVCVLESDGFALHRVSVWDYREKTRIFALDFGDPVSYLNYSAGGRFIIIAHSGRAGLLLVDSETGESLSAPEISGTPVFAATGRSERFMLAYLGDGRLSYRDLETGDERETLAAPSRLSSLVLFGGNRFLAGLDGEDIVILDAVSAEVLARREAGGAFLSADPQGREVYSLTAVSAASGPSGNGERIYELSGWREETGRTGSRTRRAGNFIPRKRIVLEGEDITSFLFAEGEIFFGTGGGKAGVINENGGVSIFAAGGRKRIIEAAVSGETLAVITEDNELGFLPL